MSIRCPRENEKEWKYAESKLGVDRSTLLYIYDFLGQREPSMKETNRLNKGETLTPSYNQRVWDVEIAEHLTKGRHAIARTDKYGIEEVVFEETRTQIKQPQEASDKVAVLNKKHEGEFEFSMRPTKNRQAFNIIVKDLTVGLRPDSNGKLQIDQSPKKPVPVITINEGNEYVRDGVVYPSYEDASKVPEGLSREELNEIEDEVRNQLYSEEASRNEYDDTKNKETNISDLVGMNPGQDHRTTPEPFDRALFDRIKERLLKVLPYVENIVEDTELPVAGRLMPGGTEIRLNPLKVANDTLGHEFGHILIDLVGGMSNSTIASGREQLRGTDFEREVLALYPELAGLEDDRLDKEVLARALGKKVTELFKEEEKRTKFENWMVRFYRKVRNALGIEISVVQRLAETMLINKPLSLRENATSRELKEGMYIQRELGMVYYQDSKADHEDGKIVQNLIKSEELLRKEAVAAVDRKINLYSKRANNQQAEKALETLRALKVNLDKSSPTRALIYFIKNAVKTTKDITDLYSMALRNERKGDPKAFTQRMLDEWRTYLSAYDVLDQYKDMLVATNLNLSLFSSDIDKKALNTILAEKGPGGLSNRELIQNIEKLSLDGKSSFIDALLPILDDVVAQKNMLKKLYETKGKELTINFLLPYVSQIETDYRETAWRKFPTLSEADRAGRDREQYITDYISDNREEITRKTRDLVAKEIETGHDDIPAIGRYVFTVLDSPDVISSTLAKIWVTHMNDNKRETKEVEYDFVDRIKALEKQLGRDFTKSDEEFFKFLLERDPSANNILTQFLVSAVPSRLDKDWSDFSDSTREPNFRVGSDNHVADKQERFKAREEWLEKWAPLDEEARYKVEFDFLESLKKEKIITIKQLEKWKRNYKVTDYRAKLKDEDIFEDSPEGLSELRLFRRKNYWGQRILSKFYDDLNGQWKELEKMKTSGLVNGVQTDQRIVFYDFIVDSMEKSDNLLPYRKRLGYRLPGMNKSFGDRLRSGEGIALASKRATGIGLTKTTADEEKGAVDDKGRSELVNEAHETIYLIPTPFVNEVALTDQFFDVGTLYFGFRSMAMNFRSTADVLPEIEMGKWFLENREVTRRDSKGRPFTDALSTNRSRELTKSGQNSNIAAQFSDFLRMTAFGQRKAEEPDIPFLGLSIDRAKFLDSINRYTSVSLLGLNMVAGTSNLILGESIQAIEGLAGEYVHTKNLLRATKEYYKNFGEIVGDIGERRPVGRINLLNDRFETLNEFSGGRLNTSSRFREMMQLGTLFFISHAGEHYMQTRFMMAMLDNIPAKTKEGEVIGTMLDMYTVDKGTKKLVIDPRVKWYWTAEKETEFKNVLKRVLSRMHGEYSQEGMSAMQLFALGRMSILFRKFLIPGFNRRWQKRHYNNLSESYTEGSYLTFGKFFGALMKDIYSLKFELLSSKSTLLPMEKANIVRALGELATFLACIVLGRFALKMKDDDPENERLWSFMAYQAFRLRAEASFYILPTSAMQILRTPMASMSLLESITKLTGQLMDPLVSGTFAFDVYDRGGWKGQPKIYKTLTDMTPGFKQYFRVRDIENQLSWFQQASVTMK